MSSIPRSGVGVAARAFLDQSAALAAWLDGLPEGAWARPSVLVGWDVRTLVGHIVLVQQGFGTRLAQPADGPAVPAARYVTRYRPAAELIAENTRATTGTRCPAELIALLRDTQPILAAAEGVADRAVVAGGRGPITAIDWAVTRIIDLVVHCDDLRRSLPGQPPVGWERPALATATRALAEIFAAQAPGRSVEVRVPPFVAVQAIAGPRHTRGTPPSVVETDPVTWLRLCTGRVSFAAALADTALTAGGARADLSQYLPVLS